MEPAETGAGLCASGRLPHLSGVTQLELAAVASPADAVATLAVSEQLQEELPQLNGTCGGQAGEHTGFLAPDHVSSMTQRSGLPRFEGSRVQIFPI